MTVYYPHRNININGEEVSDVAIMARVELLENGVPMCTIVAENDDAKQYLGTINLNDVVIVKMVGNHDPHVGVNWANQPIIFRGKVQDLSPLVTSEGIVCQVVALGDGFQIREMKVNKKYGIPNLADNIGLTWDYVETIKEWLTRGNSPYIDVYQLKEFFGDYNQIYYKLSGGLGKQMGKFQFLIDPDYHSAELDKIELHIVAGKGPIDTEEPDSVDIRPYYSIDNGQTWNTFTGDPKFTVTASMNTVANEYPFWGENGPSYDPMKDANPPDGEDLSIDIKGNVPYWNKDFRIKLEVAGASELVGVVGIVMMYLDYQFKTTYGKSVRQIIAGDVNTEGLVPTFIDKMGVLLVPVPSGYEVLNTDYVYGDADTSDLYKIPYINFTYSDGLTSIQEIIKYASALRLVQGLAGLHWILAPNSKLYLAPINTHSVDGKTGYNIGTYWVLKPYPSTPLIVFEDMVVQKLKHEVPYANFVLISGKYQYPTDNNIAKGEYINNWYHTGGMGGLGERKVSIISADTAVAGQCLEFQGQYNLVGNLINLYAYPFPADLDILKLMGKEATPRVVLNFKAGGFTASHRLIFFLEKEGVPDAFNYFWYPLENLESDVWKTLSIDLPNIKYFKDMKGWNIVTDGSIDFGDFKDVKYVGIGFYSTALAVAEVHSWCSTLLIQGVILRGAYDYLSIKPVSEGGLGHGCRTLTIKDSMSTTSTLNPDDKTSPLSIEVLYELQRHSKERITGEIAIHLDPIWKAGQQVYILAEYDPDLTEFKVEGWFRITKVTHEFSSDDEIGAQTRLEITNDLLSSVPLDTTTPYTVILRALNPDFQSKTTGSLKTAGDFDQGLDPIIFTGGMP